jgi:hypothetical protein
LVDIRKVFVNNSEELKYYFKFHSGVTMLEKMYIDRIFQEINNP